MVVKLQFVGGNKYRQGNQRIKRLRKKVSDFRPTWKLLLPVMAAGLGRAITTEGSSLGERWAPLSKSYRKRKKGPGIFQESGKTLKFLKSVKKAKIKLNKKLVAVGPKSKIRHMFIHLAGSKRAGIPARKFIGWDNQMLAEAQKILKRELTRNIVDSGRGR